MKLEYIANMDDITKGKHIRLSCEGLQECIAVMNPLRTDADHHGRLFAASPKLFELLESAAIVLRQFQIDTSEIDGVLQEIRGL